jgi:hypothetical protein
MLCGRGPFTRETVTDTLAAVLGTTPDWTALPASTPAGIRRLLQRCLEKDPQRRMRDMGDVRIDLSPSSSYTRAAVLPRHGRARHPGPYGRRVARWFFKRLVETTTSRRSVGRPPRPSLRHSTSASVMILYYYDI